MAQAQELPPSGRPHHADTRLIDFKDQLWLLLYVYDSLTANAALDTSSPKFILLSSLNLKQQFSAGSVSSPLQPPGTCNKIWRHFW